MKNIRRLTGIIIFLTIVLMAAAFSQYQGEDMTPMLEQFEFYLSEGWDVVSLSMEDVALIQDALETGKYQKASLPYNRESGSDEMLVFRNTITMDFASLTLGFTSTDAAVCVFLDGEIIYEYGIEEDGSIGRVQGSNENFVDIPNAFEEGELWIVLMAPYSDAAVSLDAVRFETRDMVVINVVGGSITDIGCCVLMLLMAFIMMVIALIRWYTHQPSRGEVFFGMASVAAGIYCFIGTDALSIFYDMYEAYAAQAYLILLLPLFLALYFERNLRAIYPRRFSWLLMYVNISVLLQILLQLFGVRKMEEMSEVSAVAICVVGVMAIVSLIQYNHRKGQFWTLLSIIALAGMLSGVCVNWVMDFITGEVYSNTEQYWMTVFSIMMTALHVFQLSREYRQNAEIARQEALAASEAKGKFLAHMSHEIRTPINAVLGMDEMILRETKEAHIKEYAMDIYTAGQTLLSLINDILDFSKIESGKMEIVPVEYDISSMIHDLVNMASQRAKNKNIKLEVTVDSNIPSRLYGDDVRIRQVLTNILTNAVKYTHQGTVWLRVKCHTTDETAAYTTLTFEVEDTGIGIKEEDLSKLSSEFARIEEDRNRNIEGTGLGMNITTQLLELLGSKMQVESTYGKGSKFYFALEQKVIDHTPIGDFESRIHQAAENYHYSTRFCAPDAKILVVDDNAVNRKVLRNLLKETLIQVTEAGGGRECLELVRKNHYDLIFLDHMMPEMDGIETLHCIKKLEEYPCQDTPIVVLTANAVSGAKEKYLAEGFDDFLSKPIIPDKLEKMIGKMLPDELLQEVTADREDAGQNAKTEDSADVLENLPQVDGLDWQYAWLHLSSMELLEYTVKEFYAQIDSSADRLEEFYGQIVERGHTEESDEQIAGHGRFEQSYGQTVNQEPLEQYRIQVHAMKSLAATVGIMPLSGIAKLLEFAAKDGNIEVVISVTPAFLAEWRSYRQKLQGVFDIGTTVKEEITDKSVILALVEMIRLSMQVMDIDQADQLAAQLQNYAYPDDIEENIRKLVDAVTNLDLEETEQVAALLAGQLERV